MTYTDRKSVIVDACLAVIARDGVTGVSHRKVAEEAGVPLGSMTYHFTGMDDLLHQAFERFAERAGRPLESALAEAEGTDSVIAAIAGVIMSGIRDDTGDLVLNHELYTIAARRPEFRDITERWIQRSRTALERHLPPDLARDVDAYIEGLTLHGALAPNHPSMSQVVHSLQRVIQDPHHK